MKRKYELNLYAPFQYEDIQRHLEEMAERGWELERIGYRWFVYRPAEPGPIRYALAFHPEVGNYDPLPTQGQEIYADYCQEAGWELVDTWSQYPQIQFYRSRQAYPLPLQTDLSTQWRVMTTWMETRFVVPLRRIAVFFTLFLIPYLAIAVFLLFLGPPDFWIRGLCWALLLLLISFLAALLVSLSESQRWLEEARRAAQEGLPGPGGHRSRRWNYALKGMAAVGAAVLSFLLWAVVVNFGMLAVVSTLAGFLLLGLVGLTGEGLRKLLRERGPSAKWNRVIFWAVSAAVIVFYLWIKDQISPF